MEASSRYGRYCARTGLGALRHAWQLDSLGAQQACPGWRSRGQLTSQPTCTTLLAIQLHQRKCMYSLNQLVVV
jgi:hypothetical protein